MTDLLLDTHIALWLDSATSDWEMRHVERLKQRGKKAVEYS